MYGICQTISPSVFVITSNQIVIMQINCNHKILYLLLRPFCLLETIILWYTVQQQLKLVFCQTLIILWQACSTFCGMQAVSAIWSACRKHEIHYTEWRMANDYVNNCTCVFVYASCVIKIYKYKRKNLLKNALHTVG
jgi:hypothetical protein